MDQAALEKKSYYLKMYSLLIANSASRSGDTQIDYSVAKTW